VNGADRHIFRRHAYLFWSHPALLYNGASSLGVKLSVREANNSSVRSVGVECMERYVHALHVVHRQRKQLYLLNFEAEREIEIRRIRRIFEEKVKR
jgi:hypothetical protein